MAQFEIIIKISPEDVAILQEQEYSLYVLALANKASGGAPILWSRVEEENLSPNTKITWAREVQESNSLNQMHTNTLNDSDTTLTDQTTVKKDTGQLFISANGVNKAITFKNLDHHQYDDGSSQSSRQEDSVLSAFPAHRNDGNIVGPLNQIALIFSAEPFETADVITSAMSSGVLIDLSDTEVTIREVLFSVSRGWSTKTAPWLDTFNSIDAFLN